MPCNCSQFCTEARTVTLWCSVPIFKRLNNYEICYWQTRCGEVWVSDAFRTDIVYCTSPWYYISSNLPLCAKLLFWAIQDRRFNNIYKHQFNSLRLNIHIINLFGRWLYKRDECILLKIIEAAWLKYLKVNFRGSRWPLFYETCHKYDRICCAAVVINIINQIWQKQLC